MRSFPGSADSEVSEEQKKEKVAELKKKEKALQDTLTQKLEELKKICLREAVSVALVYFVTFQRRFKLSPLTVGLFSFAGAHGQVAKRVSVGNR